MYILDYNEDNIDILTLLDIEIEDKEKYIDRDWDCADNDNINNTFYTFLEDILW